LVDTLNEADRRIPYAAELDLLDRPARALGPRQFGNQ
jgi:hypothetical protein